MDIIGSQSDAIYIGKGSSALSVVGTARNKSIGCIGAFGNTIITAGHDRMLKQWNYS